MPLAKKLRLPSRFWLSSQTCLNRAYVLVFWSYNSHQPLKSLKRPLKYSCTIVGTKTAAFSFNRREALQCLRSSRRRGSEIQDEIPDSSVRMDLHTLYLEATGHKMNGMLTNVLCM